MSYEKLRGGSGIQWPCNAEFPEGCERLYTNHEFPTRADYCESYGHDLISGAPRTNRMSTARTTRKAARC
jgi:hypothetical protein